MHILGRFRANLVATAVLALAGCDRHAGSDALEGEPFSAERLLGTWVAADTQHAAAGEVALRMQKGLVDGSLRFEFQPQGRVTIAPGGDAPHESGTWDVIRASPAQLVIGIATQSFDGRSDAQYAIEFQSADRFTMRQLGEAGENEVAVTFTRLASGPAVP